MRFQLILEQEGSAQLIPINYQYELSAWIYKIIRAADRSFAEFLHAKGYQCRGKTFKLFNFSNLYDFRYERIRDRLKLLSPQLCLDISFFVDETAEHFIMGLFNNQSFRLGDRITQADLRVARVAAAPVNISNNTVQLRTRSPLVVSQSRGRGEPARYLSPTEEDYADLFWGNLLDKYRSIVAEVPPSFSTERLDFRCHTRKPKSRLVTIKADTPQETQVRGFFFDFELSAPLPLLELGLLAGFGGENAMGFGCCDIVKKKFTP
jgi:CRISPR-associated endoribonuclease Cas6